MYIQSNIGITCKVQRSQMVSEDKSKMSALWFHIANTVAFQPYGMVNQLFFPSICQQSLQTKIYPKR